MMLALLKALSDSTRLRLLGILSHGEFTVQELTAILAMGQSRISRHLRILTDVGVASVKRQGTWGYYGLDRKNPLFQAIWEHLQEHLEEMDDWRADRRNLISILEERRVRSQRFFDQHACRWDRLTRDLLPVADYRDELLDQIPDCSTLLEVGCGTGGLLLSLRGRAERLLAVDHSLAMLNEARRRCGPVEGRAIEFRLGEMSHLPLGDGEVDWAVLNMVLHHAPQPAAVLQELARVLVPGGGLTIADLQRHDREWVRDELADQWLGFGVEELENWFIAAGFCRPLVSRISGREQQCPVLLCMGRKAQHSSQIMTKIGNTSNRQPC